MKRLFLIISVFFTLIEVKSQPTNGTTGLLNIPSAEMQKDGTFIAGANFLPIAITPETWNYNTGNYFLNVTFLPFLEVSYRMTLFKLNESNHFNNQDRALALRFRLIKEKKYLPAIVFGVNDFYKSSGGISINRYFSNLYFVATKNVSFRNNFWSTTVGFAPDVSLENDFKGLFGGISFAPSFIPNLKLMAEYDTSGINSGAGILLFEHLYLYGMAHEMKRFSGGFSFIIFLKS